MRRLRSASPPLASSSPDVIPEAAKGRIKLPTRGFAEPRRLTCLENQLLERLVRKRAHDLSSVDEERWRATELQSPRDRIQPRNPVTDFGLSLAKHELVAIQCQARGIVGQERPDIV